MVSRSRRSLELQCGGDQAGFWDGQWRDVLTLFSLVFLVGCDGEGLEEGEAGGGGGLWAARWLRLL